MSRSEEAVGPERHQKNEEEAEERPAGGPGPRKLIDAARPATAAEGGLAYSIFQQGAANVAIERIGE